MSVSSDESLRGSNADQYPLLMERRDGYLNVVEHVIDIDRRGESSSSESSSLRLSRATQSPRSGSLASSRSRRNSSGRHNWSPFNSRTWISVELAFTVTQIIVSLTVLWFSRHEHPQAPLFAWVIGYTAGCIASLPVLYWRFIHCNQEIDGMIEGSQSTISLRQSQSHEHEDHQSVPTYSNARIGLIMDYYKITLDCFFAAWFVVGNVWVFGGHTSVSEAPNLYRLCIVYLTLSCIGYAMPFVFCAMICCCLPCMVSVLGIGEDQYHVKGATEKAINKLPTYNFKVKKDGGVTGEPNPKEGGIVAIGTEKERIISEEDAVCCICLARYMDDDQLRELPCSHFFHAECVDRWLKISATCPLCKYEIIEQEETPSFIPADQVQ